MAHHSRPSTESRFHALLVLLFIVTATALFPVAAVAGDPAPGRSTTERGLVPSTDVVSLKPEILPVLPMTMDEARRQGRGMRVFATLINTVAGLAVVGNAAMIAHPSKEPVPALWAVGGGVFLGGITLDIAGRSKAKKAILAVARSKSRIEEPSLTAVDRK